MRPRTRALSAVTGADLQENPEGWSEHPGRSWFAESEYGDTATDRASRSVSVSRAAIRPIEHRLVTSLLSEQGKPGASLGYKPSCALSQLAVPIAACTVACVGLVPPLRLFHAAQASRDMGVSQLCWLTRKRGQETRRPA